MNEHVSPLYCLVQLIYNGLKNSLMGSDVRPVQASSKEGQGCTLCVTPRLPTQHKLNTNALKLPYNGIYLECKRIQHLWETHRNFYHE